MLYCIIQEPHEVFPDLCIHHQFWLRELHSFLILFILRFRRYSVLGYSITMLNFSRPDYNAQTQYLELY